MPITFKTRTVFHCVCIRPECRHEWDALKKPRRCAGCKYRSWNGEDHRLPDPYRGVPVASQIENGKAAPSPPSTEALLDTLNTARTVIADLVASNSPCTHKKGECICKEKEFLTTIDQQIKSLKALLPRRSTYLVQKPELTAGVRS